MSENTAVAYDAPGNAKAKTNFVLVHGAFHGGWCWDEVAAGLRKAGHTVLAPDLPGAGEDGTPLSEVTLGTSAERVVETLRSLTEPAVLVGHSMGGVVITQVAAQVPELVARMVYVTAFRPVHGESLLDLSQRPEGAGDMVQPNITIEGEPPVGIFDLTQAASVFYNGVPAEVAEQATRRLNPQPVAVYTTPVDLEGVALPPQEYVVCTQDQAMPLALQLLMATRSPARIHELDAGHAPFYSHPNEIVKILLGESEPRRESGETSAVTAVV
jgi:pimeloyl-ACP methyl ester carboxylesterase